MDASFEKITDYLNNNKVVLFMKGTKDKPMCGFSATVVNILNSLKLEFLDVDILNDPQLRDAIKVYSDWPTIPQLYLDKEFIGGCDIAKELFSSGELIEILQAKKIITSSELSQS